MNHSASADCAGKLLGKLALLHHQRVVATAHVHFQAKACQGAGRDGLPLEFLERQLNTKPPVRPRTVARTGQPKLPEEAREVSLEVRARRNHEIEGPVQEQGDLALDGHQGVEEGRRGVALHEEPQDLG